MQQVQDAHPSGVDYLINNAGVLGYSIVHKSTGPVSDSSNHAMHDLSCSAACLIQIFIPVTEAHSTVQGH